MRPIISSTTTVVLLALFAGCEGESTVAEPQEPESQIEVADAGSAEQRPQEAVSFSGTPLYRPPVDPEQIASYDEAIDAIEKKSARSEDDYIELGFLYIAGNRFRDAIDAYTRGLEDHPDSFKLRRHRGHRYINVRELEKAIVDLNEAVELMGDTSSDVMEYRLDGSPNATYEHWVWYHVGLYHYLNENYGEAAEAYQKCIDTAINNTNLVGASDWLYNTFQKAGDPESAARVVAAISPDIETDRNHVYFQRVMLYKGMAQPGDILDIDKPEADWNGRDITIGYGVANWYKYNGDEETADKIYRAILQSPYWSAWAYVVTDRENARRN